MLKIIFACLFCLAPSLSSAYCFMLYNASGQLTYRSVYSPIDLSVPISQGLAAKYPGGHLTFVADESSCAGFEQTEGARPRAAGTGRTPASSERSTALDASPLFVDSKPLGGHDANASYSGAAVAGTAGARAAGADASARGDTRPQGATTAPSSRAAPGRGK